MKRTPNTDTLEDGIAALTNNFASKPLPLMRIAPNPTTDLGKLTAEAVRAQYDDAAKSVEVLGDAVRTGIADLETAMADLAEAADQFRKRGEQVQRQIEQASMLTADIRELCAGFNSKVT